MALTEIAVATGHDIADGSLTLFSTWFGYEPRVTPAPIGATANRALDGRLYIDGMPRVNLEIGGISKTKADLYIDNILGGHDTAESVAVTIAWLNKDEALRKYNAWADPVEIGEDFVRRYNDEYENFFPGFVLIEDITA